MPDGQRLNGHASHDDDSKTQHDDHQPAAKRAGASAGKPRVPGTLRGRIVGRETAPSGRTELLIGIGYDEGVKPQMTGQIENTNLAVHIITSKVDAHRTKVVTDAHHDEVLASRREDANGEKSPAYVVFKR
jgi:hypothetical protein